MLFFLTLVKAAFQLWGTILLLVITRIPQLGLKALLTLKEPSFGLSFGSLGEFSISPALVVSLKGIFGTGIAWDHKLLYVPSIVPFMVISLLVYGIIVGMVAMFL